MSDKLTGPDLEDALAQRGLPSEGSADDKRAAVAKFDAEQAASTTQASALPEQTRLDDDVTKPSRTAPGDGPADTTDPLERAYSVEPAPGAEARAAGTVNAVRIVPVPQTPPRDGSNDRFEEYDTRAPDGSTVRVRRNIETGESRVIGVVVT